MNKTLIIIFLLFFSVASFAGGPPWRSNYETALKLISEGKYEDSLSYLKMSIADKPVSQIVRDRYETFEYLPYLQTAICYYHLGKRELAAEHLDLEKNLPAIRESSKGKKLMEEYSAKLASPSSSNSSDMDLEAIRQFEKRPYLLTDIEVQKMKEDIRSQCALPKADERSYPWYYHYELGIALTKKNDWQRALDSFLEALDHRDKPNRFSRTYGVWFVDYYPYYNIGMAHYHLQNWKCAVSSFRLSRMLEDIPRGANQLKLREEYEEKAEHSVQQ